MNKAKIKINKNFIVGRIDNRVFGSFVEHLGRTVYGGIYQPDHPSADDEGFRKDVIDLVKEIGVPIVRYPGGNFVSGYNWEDGVGPIAERPVRRDLAWGVTESNRIGTNEFASWAKKANTEVMMAVNLGTRGADEARKFLEYCNCPSGTYLSDLRIKHGVKEPHNIKLWCLGNEMDGSWQIGRKTAQEYGRLACETAHIMKMSDPSIELVACGSSGKGMHTFGVWDAEVLNHTFEFIDYISAHAYYRKHHTHSDSKSLMALTIDMDDYIKKLTAICDCAAAKKRSNKKINISVDEWNIMGCNSHDEDNPYRGNFSVEEAVFFGSMVITLLRHADRVKIACQALLVNEMAPITADKDDNAWRQSIFYPYMHASKYGRGTALNTLVECDKYDCADYTDVPVIDSVAVETEVGVTLFAVNRSEEEVIVDFTPEGYICNRQPEHISLWDENKLVANTRDNSNRITPKVQKDIECKDNNITLRLKPLSWNMIRI